MTRLWAPWIPNGEAVSARAQMGPKLLKGRVCPRWGSQWGCFFATIQTPEMQQLTVSHTPKSASPPGIFFSGAGNTIMILWDRRNSRQHGLSAFQFLYLHLIKPKDAGEQGPNGEFLMYARIVTSGTYMTDLPGRQINSPSQGFLPNTKDWRGFQALLEKS